MRLCITTLSVLAAVAVPAFLAEAAEIVRLTEDTYAEYAPAGKESEAICGDFVLRNERIVAVIADPSLYRQANLMTLGVGGGVLDLTTRQDPNDQLQAYVPWKPFSLVFPEEITVDGVQTPFETAALRPLQGATITISFMVLEDPGQFLDPEGRPLTFVRYILEEGAPYLTIETTVVNPNREPVSCKLMDYVRLDQSSDERAIQKTPEGPNRIYWGYYEWFDQAYVAVSQDRVFYHAIGEGYDGPDAPSVLAYLEQGEDDVFDLAPGQTVQFARRIVPGRSLLEAMGTVRALQGVEQHPATLVVRGANGAPVSGARVEAVSAPEFGWGRTGADGAITVALPLGAHEFRVSCLGYGSADVEVSVPGAAPIAVELPAPGYVDAAISGVTGGPIPCKVQFIGKNGTADPFLGPECGVHGIHNVYYTPDGRFTQPLEPGDYDVIVSRGPEYDAVFTEITIERGKATPLAATLVRTVDTTGWISGDLHNHTTESGDNLSCVEGRVLNLVCENIEFAPATDHNRLYSYGPVLQRLGLTARMATSVGVELTSVDGDTSHHNAFPLQPVYHTQDNHAPQPSLDPEVHIARLAMWDDASEKLVQLNHPDMNRVYFDRNGDGEEDGGLSRMHQHVDVIEIRPPGAVYWAPLTDMMPPGSEGKYNPASNRIAAWLRLWSLGKSRPGVVNTDAHSNFHGSGKVRNYIESPTDDPAAINEIDVVQALEAGRSTMTNGPFLELNVSPAGNAGVSGTVGDTVAAPSGEVDVHVRVQCANWLGVDRVDVLINGERSDDLVFTRETHAALFREGTVRFEHSVRVKVDGDAYIVAAAIGRGATLSPVMGRDANENPVALTNPVFVKVN